MDNANFSDMGQFIANLQQKVKKRDPDARITILKEGEDFLFVITNSCNKVERYRIMFDRNSEGLQPYFVRVYGIGEVPPSSQEDNVGSYVGLSNVDAEVKVPGSEEWLVLKGHKVNY